MASYFDEHNCQPLPNGQAPDHLLHLARMLQEGGYMEEFEELFGQISASPPASKQFVKDLKERKFDISHGKASCAVCILDYTDGDCVKELPCHHEFHKSCVLPWLNKTNTCPVCRHELPTDDEAYEALKQYKSREAQRKHDLENLHDSMFG